MDHPDDDQHALLDPNLPQDDGLAVLTGSFDHGPDGAQAAVAGGGSPQQRDQQQQHPGTSAAGGQPQQQAADGYPHPDAAYGFGTQGEHGEGDLLVHDRPPASDDGHSAAGGGGGDAGSVSGGGGSGGSKRRRSGPPGGVELDLSTPEGQAKKKQRAARAAYMRDYRKKKSLGKAGGKCGPVPRG
jgi:hypothetical protein